jgi:hypothetical protein
MDTGIGRMNVLGGSIPPISIVPTPDLSNLDTLQPTNPDLSAQTDLTNLDAIQLADGNMAAPDLSNLAQADMPAPAQSDLSNLAQAEMPPPPMFSTAQPVEPPSAPSVLPQDMSQIPSVLPQGMGQMPSGSSQNAGQDILPAPQNMGQRLPLFASGNTMFDNSGGNAERLSRSWSLDKSPVFIAVQDNPIMRRSRITNKIGNVANRNGATVTASKLRLI